MEEIVLPRDRQERRDWLRDAGVHAVAAALNRAGAKDCARAFRELPAGKALPVFSRLEPPAQKAIVEDHEGEERKALIEGMAPDNRARLIAYLPEDRAQSLLESLGEEARALTRQLLSYPEQSAGRIMTPEFVRLRPDMSVADALEEVRAKAERAETIHFMPVVDEDMTLVGTVGLGQLVLAEGGQSVADVATRDVPSVETKTDQEAVARLMKEADLMAVPVIGQDGRLVGIVTFDDAMEVLEFEQAEDIARAGATEPAAEPYLSVSLFGLVRSRITWLAVLMLAYALTVQVLDAFEAQLEETVALALFIPLLIGMGGNAGTQSVTTVVRALAVRDIGTADALAVAGKEVGAALVMGAALALAGYALLIAFFPPGIALTVALSGLAIIGFAALSGAVMPMVARVLSIDPAVFSSPVVNTVIDAVGLVIYFLIAKVVLGI